jgi:hypothetical protein
VVSSEKKLAEAPQPPVKKPFVERLAAAKVSGRKDRQLRGNKGGGTKLKGLDYVDVLLGSRRKAEAAVAAAAATAGVSK